MGRLARIPVRATGREAQSFSEENLLVHATDKKIEYFADEEMPDAYLPWGNLFVGKRWETLTSMEGRYVLMCLAKSGNRFPL